MSIIANFFEIIKRRRLCVLLERHHRDSRAMTEWYPDWFYEIMERDAVRNRAYEQVVQEQVPGLSVLEIGTGPHVFLSAMCHRAGASEIIALEANQHAFRSACDYATHNQLDRLRLLHGFSDQITLQQRSQVLIHELVGSIGSSEGMARFVADAKRRLLVPNAVHIPAQCNTYLFPTEHPRLNLIESLLGWIYRGQRLHGKQFLRAYNFPIQAALAPPQEFETIVFQNDYPLQDQRRLVFNVARDGWLSGFALFIRLFVDANRIVDSIEQATNWSVPYIRLYNPALWVKQGSLIVVDVKTKLNQVDPSYTIEVALGDSIDTLSASAQYAWNGA